MTMTLQFSDMMIFNFFWCCFVSLSLVTCPSFMSISSLVQELWQFPFIRDWPEYRKSEIPPSEFCPISGAWCELGIPNLARMYLIKCYWMLQNARVTTFTASELLRENQQGVKLPPTPPRLGLKKSMKRLHLVHKQNRVLMNNAERLNTCDIRKL